MEITTDESMRELRTHGNSNFPFKYYYEDLHSFDGHCIEYHWHNEFEWVVVESGTLECLIGLECIQLLKGDGIFINSKVIHRFESEKGAVIPNILFTPKFIAPDTSAIYHESIAPVLHSSCSYCVLRQTNEQEQSILKSLYEIFSLAAAHTTQKIDLQIAVCTLWRDFMKMTSEHWNSHHEGQDMLLQARIRTMIQFIAEHYTEKLSLADIAHSAHVSKSEALRCFHQAVGTTPVKYLIDYRLNRAKKRLILTNDTITQIASSVGIDNISYFIRIFTKEFGMTPRSFRLQHQQ